MRIKVLLPLFIATYVGLVACNPQSTALSETPSIASRTITPSPGPTTPPVTASRTPVRATSTQAPQPSPTTLIPPTASATGTADPTLTRDISQMEVTEWSAPSPDNRWVAEGINAFPEYGGQNYYTKMVVRSAGGDLRWTVVDSWQYLGLGYTVPQPLHWTATHFYYTNRPATDRCGIFFNGSDLHEVDLQDGTVREILPSGARWLSMAPDATVVAYIPTGNEPLLRIRSLVTTRERELALDFEDAKAGHIVWSPDGEELVLTLAHLPCADGQLAQSTSILHVNLQTEEITTLLERDERLMITATWDTWHDDGSILLRSPQGGDVWDAWRLNPDTGQLTDVEDGSDAVHDAPVSVYDPDPEHLWNRLFRQFYVRTTSGGQTFGGDVLQPLLWAETTYLLDGPSHQEAIALLDEFLTQGGERLVTDPVKKAMLQRDLWAVFDWLTLSPDTHQRQRQALQQRLAQAIRRLALPAEQIERLPDNYQAAVNSGVFNPAVTTARTYVPFLPPELLASGEPWLNVGREDGPMAASHVQSYPFLGRSAFLVFYRMPPGGAMTGEYLQQLGQAQSAPDTIALESGMEVALVRRMLLIDNTGQIRLAPLTEMVQLRHAQVSWHFYEFVLERRRLFAGQAGGLRPHTPEDRSFTFFNSHPLDRIDQTMQPAERFRSASLNRCQACHGTAANLDSIISLSRLRFPLPNEEQPLIRQTTAEREAALTIAWKENHQSWQALLEHLEEP